MAVDRRPFLLRLDPQLLKSLQRWAQDDLRSVNAQLEFLLRSALVRAGRIKDPSAPAARGPGSTAAPPSSEPQDGPGSAG